MARETKADRAEREELIARLDKIEAGPCVLVIFRAGPTAYFGPFENFDAAAKYRKEVIGAGVIHGISPPTNPPDWSLAGQLQG